MPCENEENPTSQHERPAEPQLITLPRWSAHLQQQGRGQQLPQKLTDVHQTPKTPEDAGPRQSECISRQLDLSTLSSGHPKPSTSK